ncbi:hypothetical protein EDC94DRAFT_650690 [Helicostylum pulchrum]|nr:hypothetical protein EDC94DRAFT_650690 [Helicostylum pulchrum]
MLNKIKIHVTARGFHVKLTCRHFHPIISVSREYHVHFLFVNVDIILQCVSVNTFFDSIVLKDSWWLFCMFVFKEMGNNDQGHRNATIAAFSGFNVGWHIVNVAEDRSDSVFPACLPMFDTGLSIGIYAFGGLAGSLASSYINGRFSRKSRVFVGLYGSCCGIYVPEISTKQSRGSLGCLNELFLNLGILFTQVFGLYMSTASSWRYLWVIPSIVTEDLSRSHPVSLRE